MKKLASTVILSSSRPISRRSFVVVSGASILAAATCSGATLLNPNPNESNFGKKEIPLGFDNFSIRAHNWKAGKLIEFASEQKLDSLLLSDLDVYENHEAAYLQGLKKKSEELGIQLHAGTGSICPTADRFTDKYGSAEELLRWESKSRKKLGHQFFVVTWEE